MNNNAYVGQRCRDSINDDLYFGSGRVIKRAIKKYGINNFKKEILEDNIFDKNELNNSEIFWIWFEDTLVPNGYNLSSGGTGGNLGHNVNKKISKGMLKRWKNPEYKARLTEKAKEVQSRQCVKDSKREKNRNSMNDRMNNAEWKEKWYEGFKNRDLSYINDPEYKKKASIAAKNRPKRKGTIIISDKAKQNMKDGWFKKKLNSMQIICNKRLYKPKNIINNFYHDLSN